MAHETKEASNVIPRRWQLAVYAAGMFSHSLNGMAMVVLPLWVVSLDVSPLWIGVALGSRYVLLMLLSIHVGSLMDRFGARRVMLIFGTIGAVVHLAYPALPWLWPLVCLQAVAGLTGSMGWLGSQVLVGQLMRGSATHAGRLSFSLRIGAFIGPPLIGAAWDSLGSGAFTVLGFWALGAVFAAALLPGPVAAPVRPVRGRDLVPRLADYRDAVNLLLVPAIALVMIVTLVRHAAIAVQHSFYVVWLDEFGITGVEIGILMAAWSVLGSLSALVVGRLVGFVEDQWLIVTAIGAQIVLISLTPLLPNYGFLLIAMALYGGSMGISQPLMISLMARSTGTAHQGKAQDCATPPISWRPR